MTRSSRTSSAALRPLDLALFMKRRLAAGETRAEIARGLGKSRGYLTFIGALIDPPDWLLELYRSGRCTAINELYELRRLHETHPAAVEQWSSERDNISRDNVYRLKNALACETSTDVSISPTLSDRASTASASSVLPKRPRR